MKIISITDMHGSITGITQYLSDVDIVLLAGDLTNFGRKEDTVQIVNEVRKYANEIYAVPGNCDYPEVNDYLTEQGINLHGKGKVINGFALIGVGGSLPALGKTPTEYSEEELEDFFNRGISEVPNDLPIILMSHQPPMDTILDKLTSGTHVGSSTVRSFIEKHQPLICFSGHIHEGVGIDSIGRTKLINPGPLRNGGYAYAELTNKVDVLEIKKINS